MGSKVYLFSFFLLIASCSNLEFVYEDDINLTNPLYKKTSFVMSGLDMPSLYGNGLRYLGEAEEIFYKLQINIKEEKTKRSVQANQAVSKLDYKLIFDYELFNIKKNCVIFNKEIVSRFSFEPRSSGYNFSSDQSLKKLYQQSGKNNLLQLINYVTSIDINVCEDET